MADLDSICSGEVSGDVLLNTTSVGMQPNEDARPVPKEALKDYKLVFDAIYTPVETALLKVQFEAPLEALPSVPLCLNPSIIGARSPSNSLTFSLPAWQCRPLRARRP